MPASISRRWRGWRSTAANRVWSTVGSTNTDWRSFPHDGELGTIVLGEDLGNGMKSMFADELGEQMASLLRYWL